MTVPVSVSVSVSVTVSVPVSVAMSVPVTVSVTGRRASFRGSCQDNAAGRCHPPRGSQRSSSVVSSMAAWTSSAKACRRVAARATAACSAG